GRAPRPLSADRPRERRRAGCDPGGRDRGDVVIRSWAWALVVVVPASLGTSAFAQEAQKSVRPQATVEVLDGTAQVDDVISQMNTRREADKAREAAVDATERKADRPPLPPDPPDAKAKLRSKDDKRGSRRTREDRDRRTKR